jgi:hypothetical protein
MSLGSLFSFKSKAQVEKEQREYSIWAFPGGQPQRDKLEVLLKELFPKITLQFSMFNYLTSKEIYKNLWEDNEGEGVSTDLFFRSLKAKQGSGGVKNDDWFLFIALVIADRAVTVNEDYPSAEEIKSSAQNVKSDIYAAQSEERSKKKK